MADLLVCVPSRGRPRSLERVAQAWHDTGAFGDGAGLVFIIDRDDPELLEYQQQLEKLGASAHHDEAINFMVADRWRPMVPKLNRAACVLSDQTYALGFAGDDHLPRTVGWAAKYLQTLRGMRTGIVYGDDGLWHGDLCTEWAMTSDIVRALGRMVPAPVEHMYSDNSVMALGSQIGCLRYLSDVSIEHMHPVAGKGVVDAVYRRTNTNLQYEKDGRAYAEWLRGQSADDIKTVLRMIGDSG